MQEQLVALCDKCKCCLPNNGHCWTCHTTESITALCGDAMCEDKLEDYLAREKMSQNRRRANLGI